MVESISIVGGQGRNGRRDSVRRTDLNMGDVVSIVGPTGSGKTTLISDIELFAAGNTPTGRHILINNEPAPPEFRNDPARHPVAMITQHTTFLSDLPVGEFLKTHARIRAKGGAAEELVEKTLAFANQLTGEPVIPECRMTELSGGQTRALLIADASVICCTPIVLLDEVENAGIHRARALQLLRQQRKIFIFVTHDPRIALLSDFRIAMRGGCIASVLHTSEEERALSRHVIRLDDTLARLRDKLRHGERLGVHELGPELEEVA